jgi:hypothetical protein
VYFDGESFSLSTAIPAWVGVKYGFYNGDSRALFSYAIGVLNRYENSLDGITINRDPEYPTA